MNEEHLLDGNFFLKSKFESGQDNHANIVQRCKQYAAWTLPTVFPAEEYNEGVELQNDYQSVGAAAVTNLSNKVMMALFQPTRPFFKMNLSAEQKEELKAEGHKPTELSAALAKAEREAMHELDRMRSRPILTDVILNLIITGNCLVRVPKGDGPMVRYTLRDFQVERDLSGLVKRMIVRERKAVSSLDERMQALCVKHNFRHEDEVSIYTGISKKEDGRWLVFQELEDIAYAHKKLGLYTDDNLPWIPLVWNLAQGHDYGTGLVENYAGDFHSLSHLAQAILDFTTIATDLKYLVDPAGTLDVEAANNAPSGAYIHGREEDVAIMAPQVAQVTDFLMGQFQAIERRIGAAFLLNTAVTRDAERVTAEEIRMQAQELESSLGGVYSRLATTLQLPMARRLIKRLDPVFGDIEPVIITGLESLSRSSDLNNVRAFFQDLIALTDVPEQVQDRIDYGALIAQLGAGHGVDYQDFLLDEEKVTANQEARAKQQAQAVGMEEQAKVQAQQ